MATSTAPQEWGEERVVEDVKLETIGQSVQGFLVSARKVEIKGKEIRRFVLRDTGTGVLRRMLETYDLCDKVEVGDIGCFVRVELVGLTDTTAGKMKNFRVWINHKRRAFGVDAKPRPAPDEDPRLVITDEDIPF